MNFITFSSREDALAASTHLELSGAPEFVVYGNEIHSNDLSSIVELLEDSGISFDDGRDDEHDQFRNDVEADADALRSAGFDDEEFYCPSCDGGDDY